MAVTVSLSPRLHRQAERIARERGTSNPQVYGEAVKESSRDPRRDHTIGVLGEMGFASYYGLTINANSDQPDSGYDFLVKLDGEHTKVDVKTTQYEDGYLPVEINSVRADLYILAYVTDTEYSEIHLLGGASKDMILDSSKRVAAISGDEQYQVEQSDLSSLPQKSSVRPFNE
jgi:hypothetical protein